MGRTILTVDDSASARQMVGFALRTAGFDVIEAVDARDALARFSAATKLVITDLNMPGMDGIGLIRQIRSDPRNRFVPILILTTESQTARRQEAKAAGATGWIVKPFRSDQLLAVIDRVLP